MVLEVIPKLMNTMVVQVMSGKLYASIVALEGYCYFYQLLLMFLEEYPELQAKVEETLENFQKNEWERHKKKIPSLGELVPLLTVSNKYSWKELAVPYLLEMFDRNVLWTLKQYPDLVASSFDEASKLSRINKTFEATKVSNRLIMFHVYFLKHIAKPPGMSLMQMKELLNLRFGRPTQQMKESLLQECKRIHLVTDWGKFFKKIDFPAPSDESLGEWLNKALENSQRKRYHRVEDYLMKKVMDYVESSSRRKKA